MKNKKYINVQTSIYQESSLGKPYTLGNIDERFLEEHGTFQIYPQI